MKYERFGRLNTVELNKYLDESKPPYDMSKIFPRSTTHKLYTHSRYAISSFKTMIKNYKYCYRRYNDCIAEIRRTGKNGVYYQVDEDENINKYIYVFTNLSPYEIDTIDCKLIYDRDAKIRIRESDKLDDDMDIVNNALFEMNERKIPQVEKDNLKLMVQSIQILPINYKDIPPEFSSIVSKPVFEEFKWRCLLFGTDIYKNNNNEDEIVDDIEIKKIKIENKYSILSHIQKYYPIDILFSDIKKHKDKFSKLNEYKYFNLKANIIKLSVNLREKEDLEYWINQFNEYNSLEYLYEEKFENLENILKTYNFLFNPYTKQYRDFFAKYNKLLSKWQTQQVFRKYKSECKLVENWIDELKDQIYEIKKYVNLFQEIDKNYQENLGDNGLANNGFGYSVGISEHLDTHVGNT